VQALGYHSGTLMKGDPVVCGGSSRLSECFRYQIQSKKWEKVMDLIDINSNMILFHFISKKNGLTKGVENAASVNIPGLGWILLGGNDQKMAQRLSSLGSKWENGPFVLKPNIYYQCAVQVICNTEPTSDPQ